MRTTHERPDPMTLGQHGCKGKGRINEESVREREGGGKPREGRSAKLSADGIYKEEVQILN